MQDMYSYVEGKLYNFKSMKVELNSYKIDLEYLNKDYEGCRGKSYSGITSSKTNSLYSSVENELIRKEKRKERLQSKITEKEREIRKIENALALLDDEELQLVELRYFSDRMKPLSWLAIGKEMLTSGKRCRHLRDRVLFKLSNVI